MLAWRRRRLALVIKQMGSSRELGLAIGHKSGDGVRAMAAGLRTLTDATMDKIEALPGRAGWFGRSEKPAAGSLTLLGCLRYLRESLEILPPSKRPVARLALKHFIDNPDELLEVAQSLQALSEPER